MPNGDDGPWTKYASLDEEGPWKKYGAPPLAMGMPPTGPPGPQQSLLGQAKDVTGDVLAGAGKGLMHTGTALSPLINKIPYIGETLAPSAGITAAQKIEKPTNTAQKIGYTGEQIGEWLLPTGIEEKGGQLAAEMLPRLGKFAPVLGRIGAGALESGVRSNLQSGDVTSGKDFASGAALGGATGAAGELGRAIAPKLAESALGITSRMRGRGKTIGEAVLGETKGLRPSTVAASASAKAGELTSQMENAVHQATQQGVTGTTQGAHDVLDNAIANTPRNAQDLISRLQSLRDALDLGGPARVIHTPDELLEMKRGIDKTIKTWPAEWQHLDDVKRVQMQLRGALDKELDQAVAGNVGINQRISSLIPASKQALKTSQSADLSQRLMHRIGAHTGAALPGLAAGYYGYQHGGPLGAAAGFALPELMASPMGQMAAARILRSNAPRVLGRAIGSQSMQREGE